MNQNVNKQVLFNYVLALGDDALTMGHRLSEWCRNAPFLEEDLAIGNVALDFIGRAQMFYQYAAELDDQGRSEDDLAFLRDCREFSNLLIYELPKGDFAFTMVRQLIVDAFNMEFLEQLAKSSDERLAAIAGKCIKESRYHLRRSHDWVVRLGDGTQESHDRAQTALNEIWGYIPELFMADEAEQSLVQAGIAVDRAALRDGWQRQVEQVLNEATLQKPEDSWKVEGGRRGVHTEHLGHMLADLQFMQRAYPGLKW